MLFGYSKTDKKISVFYLGSCSNCVDESNHLIKKKEIKSLTHRNFIPSFSFIYTYILERAKSFIHINNN